MKFHQYRTMRVIYSFALVVAFAWLLANCTSKGSNDKLIGSWGTSSEESASFTINKDSIYYPELSESFSYKISDDSISIKYDGWSYDGKFHVAHDTLMIEKDGSQYKYVRLK